MSKLARLRPVIYVLVFLVLAGIFFIVTFPDEKFSQMLNAFLEKETGGQVQLESARYLPPLSIVARGVKLNFEGEEIFLDRARASTSLLSILSDTERFGVELAGAWGKLFLKISRGKDLLEITARTGGIDISRLPLEGLPMDIEGRLTLDGDLSILQSEAGDVFGGGKVAVENVSMAGGYLEAFGLGSLVFDSGQAFWSVKDSTLTIGENSFTGDIDGKARGKILLDLSNLGRSRLNIFLELKPSPRSADRLAPLFAFAGRKRAADGSVTVKIGGTLDNPKYSL